MGMLTSLAIDRLAYRVAPVIAFKMGLSFAGNLNGPDLSALITGRDLSGISPNDLESFLLADLIMEARNGDGETVYVAVESSYTVDERDTRRAIRNAGYMTRFTGKPALAAIAGIRQDWEIAATIESGKVFWYQLPERLMAGR